MARRATTTSTRGRSTSDGPATLHASFLETTAAGPSARVRPMVKGGDGGMAGDHGVDTREGATSGGPATLHASFLETTAAGPSARVRPMVKAVAVARRVTTASTKERVRSEQPSRHAKKERPWIRSANYGFGTW